jgi:hypothetical protein
VDLGDDAYEDQDPWFDWKRIEHERRSTVCGFQGNEVIAAPANKKRICVSSTDGTSKSGCPGETSDELELATCQGLDRDSCSGLAGLRCKNQYYVAPGSDARGLNASET